MKHMRRILQVSVPSHGVAPPVNTQVTKTLSARKVIKDDVNSSSTNAEMRQEIEVKDNSEIVAL